MMDRRTMVLGSAATIPLAQMSLPVGKSTGGGVKSGRLESAVDAGFKLVDANIRGGGVPGAVLGVVDRAGARAIRSMGRAAVEPSPSPMQLDTWFDLASVTKIVFTTTLILKLADEGRIDLDAPLTTAIPDLRQYDVAHAVERKLTFRQCLAHQTHFPAVEPIYSYGGDPATLKAFILQREWRAGPPVYSDINYMLLGIAIERVTGKPLNQQPLPAGFAFKPPVDKTAATERCHWRERVMRGQVHDENAYALGGMAGHAGLFGTIDGLLGFAHGLLDGTGMSAAALATIRKPVADDRTAGWQFRVPDWSGGQACSPGTIGHTGFTGTGLWIDFDRGIAWSLLTNRVHVSRFRDTGIFALRKAVGDAVVGGYGAA